MERLAEQANEIALLRDRAARLEGTLQAVLTSSSWWLTRPMRGVARALQIPLQLWRRAPAHPAALSEPAKPAEPVRRITPAKPAEPVRHITPPKRAEPVRHITFESIGPEDAGRTALPPDGQHKAVWVGVDLPYPVRDGGDYRVHRLLNRLATRGWDVLVLIFPHAGQVPPPSRMREAAAVYAGLLVLDPEGRLHGRSPIDVALRGLPAKHTDLAPEVLARVQDAFAPEAVFVESVLAVRILPALRPGTAAVVDLGAAPLGDEKALPEADLLITLAPAVAKMSHRLTVVVGADLPPACARPGGSAERHQLLLVGSAHPDDVAGVHHFLRFAWPIIRRAVPAAELAIVGGVGASIGQVGAGGRLLAGPPEPAYAKAGIVLSPAVTPGFRLEVANALRHGRPVVCWPGALAGLPGELHPLCHVATNWVMFARHALRLLEAADGGGEAVRETAERAFAPECVYAELDAALARPPFIR